MSKFLLKDGYQIAESTTDIFYDDEFTGWKLTLNDSPNIFTDFNKDIYTVSDTIGIPLPEDLPVEEEQPTQPE
jgi:hypothetical protein